MNFTVFFIVLAASFVFFIIIQTISKNKRPVRRAFVSLFSGALALLIVDLTSVFTGVYIPVSLMSIAVSVVGGIPGVTAMLALNLFF